MRNWMQVFQSLWGWSLPFFFLFFFFNEGHWWLAALSSLYWHCLLLIWSEIIKDVFSLKSCRNPKALWRPLLPSNLTCCTTLAAFFSKIEPNQTCIPWNGKLSKRTQFKFFILLLTNYFMELDFFVSRAEIGAISFDVMQQWCKISWLLFSR